MTNSNDQGYDYWRAIRELRESLPANYVFITSESVPRMGIAGGVAMQVDRATAALCIHGATHRLSTPEEIERHARDEEKRKEASDATEANRKSVIAVSVRADSRGAPAGKR